MNLHKQLATKNACYKAGQNIKPQGLMIHSTGANNPTLRRYVQPDDGFLGQNPNENHFNVDSPGGRHVCVHAFIGKLKDETIATYQILPWNYEGWHCGSGPKGSGNKTLISVEICEDDLKDSIYFNKVYQEAVEFAAYICKKFEFTERDIIDHSEGHDRGIASNHSDVMHWFPRYGKSMDIFRADVKALLNESASKPTSADKPPATSAAAFTLSRKLKYRLVNRIIKIRGNDVKAVQRVLARLGLYTGTIDGIFGKLTRAAVMLFQRKHGLKVDGIVGKVTCTAMGGKWKS